MFVKYFNNVSSCLSVGFYLNSFGNDAVNIDIIPIAPNGDYIRTQQKRVTLLKEVYDKYIDGKDNNRRISVFCKNARDILKNKTGKISFMYQDKMKGVKHIGAFGISSKSEIPTFKFCISYDGSNILEFIFKTDEDAKTFIDMLEMFINPDINMPMHIIEGSLEDEIKRTIGDNIKMILAEELDKFQEQMNNR